MFQGTSLLLGYLCRVPEERDVVGTDTSADLRVLDRTGGRGGTLVSSEHGPSVIS